MARKPLKDVAEIFFSRLYVIGTACFDECFLLQLIKESIISYKSLLLFWSFFNRHVVASLTQVLLKKFMFRISEIHAD